MLYIVPFRPLRLLGYILLFAIGRGAAHGDWQAYVICGVIAVVFLGWDILDGVRGLWRTTQAIWERLRWQYYSHFG